MGNHLKEEFRGPTLRHGGCTCSIHPNADGTADVLDWRGDLPYPKMDARHRKFGEHHAGDTLSQRFHELVLFTFADRDDPLHNLGIVHRMGDLAGIGCDPAPVPLILQFQVNGNRLRGLPLSIGYTAMPLKFEAFDQEAFWHAVIVLEVTEVSQGTVSWVRA